MVPNGAAYDNFPSFANNGTKTPPGGSTESAKYALGMVPADTFPAEWANYLFHGATAGITRLNSDTGSIKKEINTVLACKNITPNATVCDQLYCALTKIRDDAVALAWPVGSIYMNAKSATLPASIQAVGTWCAIDGRFLRACASCLGCSGGTTNTCVTLAVCHLPSHCHATPNHCHSITDHKHSGEVGSHSHTTPAHCHSMAEHCHYSGTHAHCVAFNTGSNGGGSFCVHMQNKSLNHYGSGCFCATGATSTQWGRTSDCCTTTICTSLCLEDHAHPINGCTKSGGGGNSCGFYYKNNCYTAGCCASVSTLNTGNASPTTCACQPSFTGGSMCATANTGKAAPTTCNTGSGCSFEIIPAYRDVAMWYRDA